MKNLVWLFLIIFLSQTVFAQKPRPRKPKRPVAAQRIVLNETEEFEKATAQTNKAEKINSLKKFVSDFPNSKENLRALELLASTRAAFADEKLQNGETADGIAIFKLAVADAPQPVSDKLYTEVLMQIPNSLFLRGQSAAAIEVARLVEGKAEGNAEQTLALAGFYIGLERASESRRLAEKALALKPDLPAAYQTLGLAYRLAFNLDESVNAYQKALELDANSTVSKRGLAEMKRAVGKPLEAVAFYREILAKDEADAAARNGLILALFDADGKVEAESEMRKSLEKNPKNLTLLTGAAYWYAAHNDGAKAVEYAEKAVAVEPRYTWAHIALARGLISQKRPLDAEKTLLAARQYGNFPTLEYELATARMQSGFYREAAEGLASSFIITDGTIETNLGGRASVEAKNFLDLLSLERRAAIFEMLAADTSENAEKLKALLDFHQKLEAAPNDETIAAKADEFIKGDDRMKLHRQLYAANRLLDKKSNLPKILELTKAAVTNVDAGLNVPNPAAAILAEELYESRRLAVSRGEVILVPDIPRSTLSNILRGKIEDITGAALLLENKYPDAVTRLKRAVSVLPEKSSFWRNSQWRLGTALEADGKYKDALDAYVKSYTNGEPSALKYAIVESVYQKVNGNLDGLETRIGAKPASITANYPVQSAPETAKVEPPSNAEPTPEAAPIPTVTASEKASPVMETKPEPEIVQSEMSVKTEPAPTPEVKTTGTPILTEPAPTPGIKVTEPVPTPAVKVSETPVAVEPVPTPEIKVSEPPVEEVKTEEPKQSELNPVEVKSEIKVEPKEVKVEPKESEKKPTATPENNRKSLFEPIIITVPKAEPITLKTATEKNQVVDSGERRPRVVIEKQPEKPPATCEIIPSQSDVSVINDGGTLALVVELVGKGSAKEIKAVSSSSNDLEAVYDGEISGQLKRALFIIKSVSSKKGRYLITFETGCGSSEVLVRVR